ncbi:FkbM family methyltransferase [Candidatus Pelagibacter bacterium]|nr:FkbM family methyltransferase [Candidatus Pelagibacter bacterium]
MINYIKEFPSYFNRKIKSKKISYSLTGIDLIVDYMFKNKTGFFIDIGCNHPVYNNNTYKLYKRGWNGINIDIDKKSIDLFNIFRKKDLNLNIAISSSENTKEFINFHEKSPINRLKNKDDDLNSFKFESVKKIKSSTLNSVIDNSIYKKKKIDFVSIDVEGHELEVIKGFDLEKYKPSVIIIEYLDLKIEKLEINYFDLENVLNSEIYKLMISNGYKFVNWLHSDLIFVRNS